MRLDNKQLLWLELACIPKMRPHNIKKISSIYFNLEDLFAADHMTIASRCELPTQLALDISQRAGMKSAQEEAQWIEQNNISITCFGESAYPSLLREIHDPPPVLYSIGAIDNPTEPCLAMVGSRASTPYGTQAAHSIARDLASTGITIVSGMAWGVDQAAHKGALEAGGQTIAVIGSGLDHIYPKGTKKLVQQISENGAVTTEFIHSVPPDKSTFPQRNRIVSGMCLATIVIEASERSGALITARLASEQGRDVMALPGSIYSKQSSGTNRLIQQGAKLIRNVEDIVEELPEYIVTRLVQNSQTKEKKIPVNAEESEILSVLNVDTPQHIDIIARQLDMEPADLSVTLLQMEINGIVQQLPGMKFIRKV